MSFILVADIGGTNARFGLVSLDTARATPPDFTATEQHSLRCADYPGIDQMIRAYADKAGVKLPEYACLAIAGPIHDGRVRMTNLDWEFGIEELRKTLGMKALDVINDFAALAYATPHLKPDMLRPLVKGSADPTAPSLVLGPGTGFGMAALIPCDGRWKTIATEGGHTNFAPGNEREIAVLQTLLKRQSHVSVETLICGQGLVRIYRALAEIDGAEPEDYEPVDINEKGQSGADPRCKESLDMFCAMLGSAVGDRALCLGAQGGVFLGGGIAPKIADYIESTELVNRYRSKGPMANYVGRIPLNIIMHDKAALVGTAAWLVDHTPSLATERRAS
ncbi:glucokinase [Marinimicrobium locisalis]|uniref:glucokinase n=1 Tax=Marinimicrobium locisalis TaxID=546022 RepID=UPI003221D3F1